MTTEARLAFILFFFAVWCFLGLISWAVAAVIARGRGALLALPPALAAACAAGVAVPLLGGRDATGFFVSLATAMAGGALGSAGGIVFWRRLRTDGLSTDIRRAGDEEVQAANPASEPETD